MRQNTEAQSPLGLRILRMPLGLYNACRMSLGLLRVGSHQLIQILLTLDGLLHARERRHFLTFKLRKKIDERHLSLMASQQHVRRETCRGVPGAVISAHNKNLWQEFVPIVHVPGAENSQHVRQGSILPHIEQNIACLLC